MEEILDVHNLPNVSFYVVFIVKVCKTLHCGDSLWGGGCVVVEA